MILLLPPGQPITCCFPCLPLGPSFRSSNALVSCPPQGCHTCCSLSLECPSSHPSWLTPSCCSPFCPWRGLSRLCCRLSWHWICLHGLIPDGTLSLLWWQLTYCLLPHCPSFSDLYLHRVAQFLTQTECFVTKYSIKHVPSDGTSRLLRGLTIDNA